MKKTCFLCSISVLAACGNPALEPHPMWSSGPVAPGVFSVERFDLGTTSCEDARATWTPDHGRLLAGQSGLISLDGAQRQHSEEPVADLVSLAGGGVLLATPQGFKVFDSDLQDSPLEAQLPCAEIQRFRQGPEALWMVGSTGVYRWSEEQLERISDRAGDHLSIAADHQVLVHGGTGDPLLIDRTNPQLVTAEVPLPGGSEQIVPGPEGRMHARHRDGWWLSLEPFGDEEAWHRVSLGTEDAVPEDNLWALARDAVHDGLWAVTAEQIIYVTSASTTVMQTPAHFGPSMRADVDASGSLWLFCAEPGKVLRIGGPADAEVTWSGRLESFNRANCMRCHDGTGGARNLSGIEEWRNQIDLIIDAVVSQRMPQDGRSLVGGSPSLVTAWKEGGMLE